MSREWKPGEVAMVTPKILTDTELVALRGRGKWYEQTGYLSDDNVKSARPLVVIDAEDREQVERLTGALAINGANTNDRNYWRETQAALRSLVEPPKPEEPTGWLAIVLDDYGMEWARVNQSGGYWAPRGSISDDRSWRSYDQIAAVEVLSEGRPE